MGFFDKLKKKKNEQIEPIEDKVLEESIPDPSDIPEPIVIEPESKQMNPNPKMYNGSELKNIFPPSKPEIGNIENIASV